MEGRRAVGAGLTLVFFAALSLPISPLQAAHRHDHETHDHGTAQASPPARGRPCLNEFRVVRGQGRSCRVADDLWKVRLPGGGTILTHGADPEPDPRDSGSRGQFSPDAVLRPPVCVGNNMFFAVIAVPSDVTGNKTVAQFRNDIARVNGAFFHAAVESGSPNGANLRFWCDGSGQPQVDVVQLPTAAEDATFATITADLKALGYDFGDEKYAVHYDASLQVPDAPCGQASIDADETDAAGNLNNDGPSFAINYDCTPTTLLHEMGHTLGAVQATAPHATGVGSTNGYHCWESWDVMCYNDGGPSDPGTITNNCPDFDHFDCGHDDYFDANVGGGQGGGHTSYIGTRWNIGECYVRFIINHACTGTLPPPANDHFTFPTEVSGSSFTRSGDTNVEASKEGGEPDHAGDTGGHSVWYRWTAPGGGTTRLNTLGSDFDTLLAVYTGSSVGGLSEIASNDQDPNGGDTSRLTFNAVGGTTYRIAVDGWQGNVGNIMLNLVQPPPNDDFGGAEVVSGRAVTAFGSTFLADKQPGEPNHAGDTGGHSVWYRWTAPANGTVHMDTLGSDFDTLLAVYTGGSVGALTEIASNDQDPSGGDTSRLSFGATSGTVYRIAVDGWQGNVGNLVLNIRQPPANDGFGGAIPLSGHVANRTGDTNAGARKQPGEPDHAGNPGGASVWYRWTAPSKGVVSIDTFDSTFDTLLGVYRGGSVGGLTEIVSNDDAPVDEPTSTLHASKVTFTPAAGTTYRIAVDGWQGASGPSLGTVRLHLRQAPTIAGFSPLSGKPGNAVTINGTGFTSPATVKFNGTTSTNVTVSSSKKLAATVPSGATSGKVTVTTAGGTVTSAFSFLVGTVTQESHVGVQYNGWRGISNPNANGGTHRTSSATGDTARLTFTGTSIQLITRRASDQGIANVTIDGVNKGNVDLYSAAAQNKVSLPYGGLGAGSHTIVVRVTGNKNAASTGRNVSVDAFVVGATTTQDSGAKVRYNDWTAVSNGNAAGGQYRVASPSTATATFPFTGTAVDLVTARRPAFGRVRVLIDGVNRGTFDLYASTQSFRHVLTFGGLPAGSHTALVRVMGTKNAASTGTAVPVDAFVVR